MEVLRYSRNGGRTFAYIHKCTYMCACRNVHPNIYFHIYKCVCIDLKLHTKYVCRSSLLMRRGLVAFPPLGLEKLPFWSTWQINFKLHYWAGCQANESKDRTFLHSPNWQMNFSLEFSWLLGSTKWGQKPTICEMDTFGRLPSSEIVTEHEVGEGGKKLTFRKHLKSSQVPYDPER